MKHKSYSIVEMIIVVSIIGIIAGITVPLLGMYYPQTRLNGDAKILMFALRKTQQWSITGEKRYGIDFYPTENEYILFRKDINDGISITEIETIKLSTGIEINKIQFNDVVQTPTAEGCIRIQFDSFGAPRNANDSHIHAEIVLINSKNATLKVDVRKNNGHIKIE